MCAAPQPGNLRGASMSAKQIGQRRSSVGSSAASVAVASNCDGSIDGKGVAKVNLFSSFLCNPRAFPVCADRTYNMSAFRLNSTETFFVHEYDYSMSINHQPDLTSQNTSGA